MRKSIAVMKYYVNMAIILYKDAPKLVVHSIKSIIGRTFHGKDQHGASLFFYLKTIFHRNGDI